MTSLLLIPLFVYLGLFIIALFFSERVIFRPPPASYKDGPDILKIVTPSGETISAKFHENRDAKYTILFSNGNGEDIGSVGPFAMRLRDAGFNVLTFDYRGYGTSRGTPSEANAYEDIDSAYNYLTGDLHISPDHIIVQGRSLGGGIAVDLASRKPVAGLIMESTFVTAFRVVTNITMLPWDKFRSIDKIGLVKCPVLVIHGKQDRTIPFHHGEKLFAAAPEPKLSFWVDNAGHNNLFYQAQTNYLNAVRKFIEVIDARQRIRGN